jgi:hypothetical protein
MAGSKLPANQTRKILKGRPEKVGCHSGPSMPGHLPCPPCGCETTRRKLSPPLTSAWSARLRRHCVWRRSRTERSRGRDDRPEVDEAEAEPPKLLPRLRRALLERRYPPGDVRRAKPPRLGPGDPAMVLTSRRPPGAICDLSKSRHSPAACGRSPIGGHRQRPIPSHAGCCLL